MTVVSWTIVWFHCTDQVPKEINMPFLSGDEGASDQDLMDSLTDDRRQSILDNCFRGRNVQGAKSIEAALVTAGVDFEVGLRPLMAVLEAGTPVEVNGIQGEAQEPIVLEVPGKFASIRFNADKTEQVLGVVGPTYTPLQNGLAFMPAQALMDQGDFEVMSCWESGNGARVGLEGMIGLSSVGHLSDGRIDTLAHGLSIETSHDGSRSTIASLFTIRLVCTNGMTAFENSARAQVRHTSRVVENMKEASAMLLGVTEAAMEETALYRRLAAQEMTKLEFADFAESLLNAVRQTVAKTAPKGSSESDLELYARKRARRDREIEELILSFDRGTNADGAEHGGKNRYGAYNVITDQQTPRTTEERYADSARHARALIGEREGHGARVRSRALKLLRA